MPRRVPCPDDETVPVIVPRNDRPLVPSAPERAKRLREHLAGLLDSMRDNEAASLIRPLQVGFRTRVANAACSLCQGWCCRLGNDDGFLDVATLARAPRRLASKAEVIEMYVERVPNISYQGSCIFHGAKGCTLPRAMRSDTCNAYFCNGLLAFMGNSEPDAPTVVIAAEGHDMRLSAILEP